jgi:UDP-N-acetylmuramoylalanine--D-glutamate ligase
LETISLFHPQVAVILNLTPDHIDRHGSFDAYKKAKYRITENQEPSDVFLLNREDPESVADNPPSGARKAFFTTQADSSCETYVADEAVWVRGTEGPRRVITVNEIGIKGPHNLQNVAAAVAAVSQFGAEPEVMARVLTSFPGVEHRLERVGTVAGVAFVNDSKATNVDSVRMALRSVDTPLYIILGGRDKEGVFEPLIDEGRGKIKGIIAIGEARDKIFGVLGRAFPTQFAESLQEAVELGFDLAHPGETVLLSPGCASFDMFENFEHRGRVFKETVHGLKNGKNSDETVSR